MAILLAHELGHYVACRYYSIDASLPYFLPAPTLIGTLGAFIRIRASIPFRTQLFDVGVAGPLAGFVFIIPAIGVGLALSKVIPGVAERGDIIFGTPLLLRLAQFAVFPDASPMDISLHPVARAAWVGMLATALNLLPIGQLDGGHILYSIVGDIHKLLSRLFLLALIPLGLFYSYSWLVWAVILFFFGLRHPRIYDGTTLGRGRIQLGLVALVVFVLCFTVTPIYIR
jgi:membrane-associated protease RseP (regulator of RpoE activity)